MNSSNKLTQRRKGLVQNTMLIFIDTSDSPINDLKTAETPFGQVEYSQIETNNGAVVVIYRSNGGNPKSLAYTARSLGGTRVIGIVRDSGAERPSTPTNYIEFTEGRPTTFFETIGTGYVQQNPPYCPELHQTLLAAGAQETGSLLILNQLPDQKIRSWWQAHSVSLITTHTQPEAALCRELELCYAVLALPNHTPTTGLLPALLTNLPPTRNCNCNQLMATARKFGKLSADWFETL